MSEIPKNYEEGESQKIEWSAVQTGKIDSRGWGNKYKYYRKDNSEIQDILGKLNLPPDVISTFSEDESPFTSGRCMSHFIRLLSRPGAERDFAIAFIQNMSNLWGGKFRHQDHFTETIGVSRILNGDSTNTTIFWTFAPYVFRALVSRGVDEVTAIQKMFNWTREAERKTTDHADGYVRFSGLEHIPEQYILDESSEHISHKYTEQEAEAIADYLMAENNEK